MRAIGFSNKHDSSIIKEEFWDKEYLPAAVDPISDQRIIDYLQNSPPVFAITLAITVEGEHIPYIIRSDGDWLWPGHFPFYLKTNTKMLSNDFLEHLSKYNYRPCLLSKIDKNKVENYIFENMLKK